MPGFVHGLVFVNLRGREPQGTVDEAEYELAREHIAQTLLSAEDPEGGGNLFAEVLRREDVYHGESLQLMPDLIAVPAQEYMISETFRGNNVVDDAPSMLAGTHRPNGLLVVAGPGIRSGERMAAGSIGDLAPTLLHTLGVPVPEHMDGKVLTQAFVPAYLDAHPLSAQGAIADLDRSPTQAYSSSEQAAVEKRLRDLGYMG